MKHPANLLQDAEALAQTGGWTKEVYADLLAIQHGELDLESFNQKYLITRAIFILDMTSFTENTIHYGPVDSFLRILKVQQVAIPVLRQYQAQGIRTFADDITATFDKPHLALDAALAVMHAVDAFNASGQAGQHPARACIGLGYGDVYCIGLDLAMGGEMNQASKLGEDTAKGGEILVTERFYQEMQHEPGLRFEPRRTPDIPFGYYSVGVRDSAASHE